MSRIEFLGYGDSGMMGESSNADPGCFWQADLDEAADRLLAILDEVAADVVTIYDDHGGYGHPDHIQVHRVGVRAARRSGAPRLFEATMNRTRIAELIRDRMSGPDGLSEAAIEQARSIEANVDFGSPASLITHGIDVADFLDRKRKSMAAHASQIGPDSHFLSMADDEFAAAFGTEWFIAHGVTRDAGDPYLTSLFD